MNENITNAKLHKLIQIYESRKSKSAPKFR